MQYHGEKGMFYLGALTGIRRVSLVRIRLAISHVVTILFYMHGLYELEAKCIGKKTYRVMQMRTIDSPNTYRYRNYT